MSKRKFDSNGWYEVKDNPISKSGVFQYLGKNISPELEPEEIYNVYRPDSALNNPETIDSFKLVPWIPKHEMLGDEFTPAEEVGVEGTTGEQIYFKDGTLYGNIKVYGSKLAKMIQNGIKELSLGYRCEWKVESGVTPSGEKYDAIQTGILGNHLASVPDGRMGSDVAVMDSACFALDQNDVVKIETKQGETMELEELIALVTALTAKVDAIADKVGMGENSAEDKEEVEVKAEDMEAEVVAEDADKKEDEKGAMDAAISPLMKQISALAKEVKTLKSTAVDANSVMKELGQKNELAEKASRIVGAFDHSDMTKSQVAKYTLDKLSIACDSGAEVATLNGYLASKATPTFVQDEGLNADADKSYLASLGL